MKTILKDYQSPEVRILDIEPSGVLAESYSEVGIDEFDVVDVTTF